MVTSSLLLALWLLQPSVKAARMNIENSAHSADSPGSLVRFDKGIPQSDWFAKYTAALIYPARQ
ncbi:exported hypothetical protein [Vibrio parahaemolyticus]